MGVKEVETGVEVEVEGRLVEREKVVVVVKEVG